jgi:hypothetical protein
MGAHRFAFSERTRSVCMTPEAVYTTAFDSDGIRLDVDLPVKMLNPKDEQDLLQRLHHAILPVIERLYRERWHLIAGQKIGNDPNPMPAKWVDLKTKKVDRVKKAVGAL